jgi:hypothetical protein
MTAFQQNPAVAATQRPSKTVRFPEAVAQRRILSVSDVVKADIRKKTATKSGGRLIMKHLN